MYVCMYGWMDGCIYISIYESSFYAVVTTITHSIQQLQPTRITRWIHLTILTTNYWCVNTFKHTVMQVSTNLSIVLYLCDFA